MSQFLKISLKLKPAHHVSRHKDRVDKLLAAVIEKYPLIMSHDTLTEKISKLQVKKEILFLKIKNYSENTTYNIEHIMDQIRLSIKIICQDLSNCISLMANHPGPDFKAAVENMNLLGADNVEVDILCDPPFLTDTNLVLWPSKKFPLRFLTEAQSSRLISLISQEIEDIDDQTVLCYRLLELYKIQDKPNEEAQLKEKFLNEAESCIKNTVMFYQSCGGTIQAFNNGLGACLENPGPDLSNVGNIASKLPTIMKNIEEIAAQIFFEWMEKFGSDSVIYSYDQYVESIQRKGLNAVTKTSKLNIKKMMELNLIVPGDGLYLARHSKLLVGDYAHVAVVTDTQAMKVVHATQVFQAY